MAISDSQKTDFLWKKVIYGTTNSAGSLKAGYEETIGSPTAVYSSQIIAEEIPVPAPAATNAVVQYYGPTTAAAVQFTVDPTTAGNKAWVATETAGNLTTRLSGWIPPSVDASYLVEIYKNDPAVGGNKLLTGTAGTEWIFDYQSGVLNFVNSVPAGITTLWLVGHRYIGRTGLGGAGVNFRDTAVEYEGNAVTSGTYQFLNFFSHEPQTGTITVEFNGQRMETNQWSFSGRHLTLNVDNMPFALEAGDVVAAQYAFIN
jgi:hypothetical protein